MSEWIEYKLGDIIEFIDGDRGKNYPKKEEFTKKGHCLFLNTGNVTKEGFNFDSKLFISEQKDNVLRKGKLSRGDVVLTTRGTVGNVAFYSERVPYDNLRINSGMLIARGRKEILPGYIYYLFKSDFLQEQFMRFRSGSAQPQLPIKDLVCVTARIPDKKTQGTILYLLSTYDTLIENNNRRIAILEEMTQRIYREWFVHFRFPGHEKVNMVDSELRKPEGWKATTVEECSVLLRRGISPKYDDAASGIVINQKCIRDYYINLQYARKQNKDYDSKLNVLPGDILINSTGVGTLGRVAQNYLDLINCTIDSHVTLLRPQPDKLYYLGAYIKHNQDLLMEMGVGSTGQTELNKDKIKGMLILIPQDNVLSAFEDTIKPLMQLKTKLQNKNKCLRRIRDDLLSRLISGDISVSNIKFSEQEVAK